MGWVRGRMDKENLDVKVESFILVEDESNNFWLYFQTGLVLSFESSLEPILRDKRP